MELSTIISKLRCYGLSILSFFLTAVLLTVPFTASAKLSCERTYLYQDKVIRSEDQIKELKILSYNVENLFASTGKGNWVAPGHMKMDSSEGPGPKSPEKLAEIREIILKNQPDIMVAVEVENSKALNILASMDLKGLYRPILIEGNDPRGIDIGFLVKADLPWSIHMITHKSMRWTNPKTHHEGPLFSRDLPVLEFRRSRDDVKPRFVVIGNHAKSKRDMPGDPESNDWRTEQYLAAAEIVKSYTDAGTPVIFAGDFNTDVRTGPEVKPVLSILESSLANAPDALPPEQRITHTFHPLNGPTTLSQLDDILVSDNLLGSVESAQILRYHDASGNLMGIPKTYEQRALQPSDHFPVLTVISTAKLFL